MASTRFNLLPVGARFDFEGRSFTKNAPLTAVDESSNRRMIPRSAIVETAENAGVPPTGAGKNLLAAADEYHRQCMNIIGQLGGSAAPAELERAQAALQSAHRIFLQQVAEADRD